MKLHAGRRTLFVIASLLLPAGVLVQGATASAASHGPVQASSAGTNIGNAGILTSSAKGSGTIVSGSDDWWISYPAHVGGTVTVKVTDTGSSCTISAALDGSDGRDQQLQSILVGAGSSGELAATASGSDRYYVELTPDGCSTPAPYTLALLSGGGGTPPDPAAGSIPAGTSIGNAWPPLQGHALYPAALGSTQNSDWYVLYKKPDTTLATIRFQNTARGCTLDFTLLNTDGSDGFIQNVLVDGDSAATFTVPVQESQDPQGRYFVTASSDGCGGAGEPYTIEPEPAAQWQNPAKVPSARVAAALSAAKAWPPLHGHTISRAALGSTQTPDWFLLYKKRDTTLATIRFQNTSAGCTLDFVLFGSTSTGKTGAQIQSVLVDGNAATTVTVAAKEVKDLQGRYFVAVSSDGCGGAGQPYSIEPEPSTQWETPALKVSTVTLPSGTAGKAYAATIGVSKGTSPYTFTAETALPPGLSLSKTTGTITGKPSKAGAFSFEVKITDSAKPAPRSVTDTFRITIAK